MAYTMTPEELRKFTEDGGEMTPHLKHTMEQMKDRATIDRISSEVDTLVALPPQVRATIDSELARIVTDLIEPK